MCCFGKVCLLPNIYSRACLPARLSWNTVYSHKVYQPPSSTRDVGNLKMCIFKNVPRFVQWLVELGRRTARLYEYNKTRQRILAKYILASISLAYFLTFLKADWHFTNKELHRSFRNEVSIMCSNFLEGKIVLRPWSVRQYTFQSGILKKNNKPNETRRTKSWKVAGHLQSISSLSLTLWNLNRVTFTIKVEGSGQDRLHASSMFK